MRIVFLTIAALVAFAANSILVRFALANGQISPGAFSAIRLLSGAIMLMAIIAVRGDMRTMAKETSVVSAAALLVYVIGFSFAYVSLETGTGALILFGGVQITMFAGALIGGQRLPWAHWAGAAMGALGLAVLFGPTASQPDFAGALLMGIAAISWGIYSLRGRYVTAPIAATASNFILATPFSLLIWLLSPEVATVTQIGAILAIASGALASGIGYALWYSVLPSLKQSEAAVLQLLVPIIALAGGVTLLGERFTWSFVTAAALISAGVLVTILGRR